MDRHLDTTQFCANTHAHTRRGGATIRKRVLYKPAQIRRFLNVTITRRLKEDFDKRNIPGKQARRHFSQLSEFERGLIIRRKTAGWLTRRVAGQVDRSECAVRNCWEQWTRESTHARKTGPGATRKTTRREDRRIVRQALVDPTVSHSTIRADVSVATVPQTISRHLAEANLKSERPFRALPLTPEHRQLRLQWCQTRSMWNVTDWQKVVFSDESRFVLGTDDNRVRLWRRPGERYISPHSVLRHTARTAGVMGQRYVDDILRPHVGPFLNGLPGAIFQQDNARPHTAERVAQNFLRYFQTLSWSARCLDLTPAEHVWDQLKLQMPSCHSVHDLELAVQDFGAYLPQDTISHVGVPDNESADQKAKQEAESTQPEVPLTIRKAKSIISTYIDKYTAMTQKTKNFGKPWETLATVGPIPRHLERVEVIARFCLTTGHDFLGVLLKFGRPLA
ncbi:transposable element Tc1 transposase [Trichonephila clavipes]|nr:transposable element Tc1 transposase [Trichonephila clavipes]